MQRLILIILLGFTINIFAQAQDFTTIVLNQTTSVKDQEETGSCWAYASCSFFESEMLRINGLECDLSEAFLVYNAYLSKARNYFLRQAKTNLSTGALAHDAINIINEKGLITENAFNGKYLKNGINDYFEMQDVLEAYLQTLLKIRYPSKYWLKHFEDILISYLGNIPKSFVFKEKVISPIDFSRDSGLDFQNYVSITSFTHHPFYSSFVLEIPDNFSNGQFYNVPLNDLVEVIDSALLNGFTIVWDGDVSEPTFSAKKKGIAMLPKRNKKAELIFEIDVKEITANSKNRQLQFERLQTTDDHLMHCVGLAKSKNGTKYYIMKNSWGKVGTYNGYIYMSETYLKMKTVSIMLNKDGLTKKIKNRI